MLKFCLFLGGFMLGLGVIANIVAFVLEKKYKSKMEEVSQDK